MILIIVSIILITFGITSLTVSTFLHTTSTGGLFFFAIIGFILYIISLIWAIMLSYYYSMAFIIAADKPELGAKSAVEESKNLMKGNRSKLFLLQLSFIGWAILAVCTLGIGYLWLLPYVQFATFAFYKNLSAKENVVIEEDNVIKGN